MSFNNSCNICCDNYNKSTRIKLSCPYCEFEVCRSCCETYILSETVPKCMNPDCAKEWTRKFLRENFTNVFLTSKYKEHLEDVLFDKEKALLPATQPLVEEKIAKKYIRKQLRELDLLIEDLYKQKRELEHQIQFGIITGNVEKEDREKARFVRQCPSNGCRGFLSTQWKCGICEQWSCPDCHELKGPNRDCQHICDPNNVETAKMLAKDSKPCPKCQSMIFKVSGCDQMWCTQCHTAFSWKTGKLENNIHNPHFYEWQRKNGGGVAPRNPRDIECGRELGQFTTERIQMLARQHSRLFKTEDKECITWNGRKEMRKVFTYLEPISKFCDIIRNVVHNNRIELPNFQTDYVVRNQDLRIKYLENLISEDEFKMLIQRNDKRNRKNTEIAQVLQLANTAVTDIVYRLIDIMDKSSNGDIHIDSLIGEIEEINKYCNEIFKDISFTYNTVQYAFNELFGFIRLEKEKKNKSVAKKKLPHDDNYYSDDDENEDEFNDIKDIQKISKAIDNL